MNSTEWIGYIKIEAAAAAPNHINWLGASICSALVGLTGLIPILLLPKLNQSNQEKEGYKTNLRWMLSFAVGGLLGDVFLHLLPEAMGQVRDFTVVGLWVLCGLLAFTIIEKVLNANLTNKNAASGYLNLFANCIDNFNHGLAVGAAFLVSDKAGFITTMCILVHEIPHEVGDFAILMRSGFNKVEAAKAQLSTAFVGILGACFALALDSALVAFIVPFTCGGFLHISLISVLPDLLESEDVHDFFRVMSGITIGMLAMTIASCI